MNPFVTITSDAGGRRAKGEIFKIAGRGFSPGGTEPGYLLDPSCILCLFGKQSNPEVTNPR